jgi:ribonuclease HI
MLPRDRLIWRGAENGIFTVRSAYHLGKELQDQEGGQCSQGHKGQKVWKAIWSLEVPNSVKLFMWKASNDLLPTKANLFKRKVVEAKSCPCCTLEEETTFHALWSCPAARDVWESHLSCFQKCYCEGATFKSLVEHCMGKMSKEDLELLAVLARRIWLRRNTLVFEGTFVHPDTVCKGRATSLNEFKRCNGKECIERSPRGTEPIFRPSSWIPPPSGIFKVNWDASLSLKKGWLGIGVIVRDCNGVCLGARSVTKQVKVDPKTTEVIAALFAMHFSKEVSFLDVIFEGDATQVVKEINSTPPYVSRVCHFLENIHLEKGYFRSVSFAYTPRECNAAAHVLAKEASSNKVDLGWLEETPRSVSDIVFKDSFCP